MEKYLKKKLPGGKFIGVSESRSKTMGKIKGKGNKTTEMRFRYALVRSGISGWRLHDSSIPGKPDFFFPKEGLAVFIDGCFWHGCPKCGHIPKTRPEFWKAKINKNRARDKKVARQLKALGISVIRCWEHEVKSDLNACTRKVRDFIRKK